MCAHYGDPSAPCPLCECGECGRVTSLYTRTAKRDGAVRGHHKRYIDGHQHRKNGEIARIGRAQVKREIAAAKAGRVIPEDNTENEILLKNLLSKALASGATGDDLVKVFIESHELAAAIVMAQVQKALDGSIQSANWLFQRGIGTAVKKTSNASKKVDLSDIFGSPLDSEDEMWESDE